MSNIPIPMLAMLWVLLCLLTLHSPLVTAYTYDLYCSRELYGTPNVDDCKEATDWIPWIYEPIGIHVRNDATAFRKFAEPQYLEPPWKEVGNQFAPLAVVQLPKIWKHKSCTIAMVLQPYRGGFAQSPNHIKPEFYSKWGEVGKQTKRLWDCLEPGFKKQSQYPQGGYTAFTITKSRPAGIYMYTSDSLFNKLQMNKYMADGRIIEAPIDRRAQFNLSSNDSSLASSLQAINSSGVVSLLNVVVEDDTS